jgi:hypothetical protein
LAFDLKTIEALAPDQASLASASKLTKRSSWLRLERRDGLLWGECQGSGANPYRVVVDAGDQGYKCTCPSRKFPCKHSLALMWISATAPDNFAPAGDIPEWVNDWLGRRRKGGASAGAPAATPTSAGKSIGEAQVDEAVAKAEDPAAAERREAAQKKRAEDTKASIAAGLDELDQWISDQLRLGLSGFVDSSSERCRRISARLVDAKAAALASRLDELPAQLMALRSEERPEAAIRELGKLVLLARAWRNSPDDAELKRLVSTSETREQILGLPDALHVASIWEVLGERIETRRDGLVSHATWLIDLAEPRFALLQDFYPASAGRRSQAFSAGERFEARLVYYPARAPLRALVAERSEADADARRWPPAFASSAADPLAGHAARQDVAPWSSQTPVLLPAGSLARDDRGGAWWQAEGVANGIALPVAGTVPEPAFGVHMIAAAGLWDGARLELLAAESAFGRLDL